MQCDRCRNEAVVFQPYSGRHLCYRHLIPDIEARAKRTIRLHRGMRPGDHIAVLLEGDTGSAALLCFMKKLTGNRRDIRLSAVMACGNDHAREKEAAAREAAGSLGIPIAGLPHAGRSGHGGPENISRIARAITLDDIARTVLDRFLFGSADQLIALPQDGWQGIPVICPFTAVPSDELDHYWQAEGTGILFPRTTAPACQVAGALLEDYSRRHPATRFSLLHLAGQLGGGDAAAALAGRGSPVAWTGSSLPRL